MEGSGDNDGLGPKIAGRALAWYDRNARTLPWRAPPGANRADPYHVWLSEVMLQQTTVAAVIPYFERFLSRWPRVGDLAAADDAEVMAAWAGLGYYARARNLLAAARAVAALGGRFPDTEAGLRALPGVGDYTAAAVAAIAFGRRAVALDANVERVIARLFAIADPLPAGRRAIRAAAETVVPDARAGDFAQALMDLGSAICLSRAPRCLLCPLRDDCRGFAVGESERFPVKAAKKPRPQRHGRAFWIERDGAVWLVRRAGRGMLGGMRALPDDGWSARADGGGDPPLSGAWEDSGREVVHGFTHFSLTLRGWRYRGGGQPSGEGEWWPLARIGEAGLPTVFARLVDALREGER